MTNNLKNKLGYVIYRGKSQINGKNVVGILTLSSSNTKLGRDFIQLWVLPDNEFKPTENMKSGEDASVCGTCQQRKSLGGSCYVSNYTPNIIYKSYKQGKYTELDLSNKEHRAYLKGLDFNLRLAAYGEALALPIKLLNHLHSVTKKYTFYTHAHKQLLRAKSLKFKPMVSVETEEQVKEWNELGYPTFRVKLNSQELLNKEIWCPAQKFQGTTKEVNCDDCFICGSNNKQILNVAVNVHGASKKRYELKVLK